MDKRKLVLAGIVAASMVVGGVLGAVVFTPRVGEASTGSNTEDAERPSVDCIGIFGPHGFGVRPFVVAAEAIGIEVTELFDAVRDGDRIAGVAEANGVDPAEVIDTLVESERDRLEKAVEDGDLTQERAEAILATAEERATRFVEGELARWWFPGRVGTGHARAWPLGPGSVVRALEELDVDLDTVVDEVVEAFRQHLDRAVEAGWLTEEEAEERGADVRERVEALLNGELGPFPFAGVVPNLGPGSWDRFGPGAGGWDVEGSTRSL